MHRVPELSARELAALERGRRKADLVAWLRREAASRDGEMAWYVARTNWRADSVAGELRAVGIEAVCPVERRWKRFPRSTQRYSVDYPLLGNHLFVHLLRAESAWVGALSFDGVNCLLGTGEKPVAMRPSEMDEILAMIEEFGSGVVRDEVGVKVGDEVVHPVGTFAELRGVVREIDAKRRTALVDAVLFGRSIATRCGIDDLEKLA